MAIKSGLVLARPVHSCFWTAHVQTNYAPYKILGCCVFLCIMLCTRVYVNSLLHLRSCTELYNLCSYLTTTTATGSTTNSTAQDDILEKPHQSVNYSVSQAHIWVKKSCVPYFPTCLLYFNWACANYAHIIISIHLTIIHELWEEIPKLCT